MDPERVLGRKETFGTNGHTGYLEVMEGINSIIQGDGIL